MTQPSHTPGLESKNNSERGTRLRRLPAAPCQLRRWGEGARSGRSAGPGQPVPPPAQAAGLRRAAWLGLLGSQLTGETSFPVKTDLWAFHEAFPLSDTKPTARLLCL